MTTYTRRTLLAGAAVPAVLTPFARILGSQNETLFPESFFWGASTSALQVESSPTLEGGGKSIWDAWIAQNPKAVKDGSSPRVTCDETHRWREDIALMRQMGLNSFRFSVSWPRVLPAGQGRVNQRGFDFYDHFIDALLAANIRPFLTVFHFDLPNALQERGGWLSKDSPKWIADYAGLLAARYSDRVEEWLTINEPNILWSFGSEAGMVAPGKRLNDSDLALGAHHLLLGHGRSVQAIRAAAKRPLKVSLPLAGMLNIPASESRADVDAARAASFSADKIALIPGIPALGMLSNVIWLDPIFKGAYTEQTLKAYKHLQDVAHPDDLKIISQPLDRCTTNLYTASRVRAGRDGQPERVPPAADAQRSHSGLEITPEVMYWTPRFLHERYGKRILISENGMSWPDKPGPDGRVHDRQRVAFLKTYLSALGRAIHDNVPVDGYLHWSLLDNWEFQSGFTEQFGLVYVDHTTQERHIKDSALYYREIIRTRGGALQGEAG